MLNNLSIRRARVSVSDKTGLLPLAQALVAHGAEPLSIGATAVIQPGRSMRDQEVIDAADRADIGMVFTGMRHFRH